MSEGALVGPLFYYDLVRLARRGRSSLLRVTYASALLFALGFAYQVRFPDHNMLLAPLESPRSVPALQLSALAASFVFSLLVVQTAAVFVLTPAYVAGAVAEERERATLELLFTTQLRDHEIVLGKLFGRLGHLAGVVLAGLPLLALSQLWGGVDMWFVSAAFLATAMNLLSVGAICIFASVICRTVLAAVVMSYALTGALLMASLSCPVGLHANPAGLFVALNELPETVPVVPTTVPGPFPTRRLPGARFPPPAPPPPAPIALPVTRLIDVAKLLGGCVACHGAVAFFFGISAIGNLRPTLGLRSGGAVRPRALPRKSPAQAAGGWDPVETGPTRVVVRGKLPPVGDWPLLWKETLPVRGDDAFMPEVDRVLRGGWPVFATLLVLVAVAVRLAQRDPQYATQRFDSLREIARWAVLLPVTLWCLLAGFRAAAGIAIERDKGTLEGLLTLPVTRTAILAAKWGGPIVYGRGFGYVLAAALVVAILGGVIHPTGGVLLVFAIAAHLGFLASLGVWLSLASRTSLWARMTMAAVLLAFLGIGLRSMLPDIRNGVQPFGRPAVNGPEPWEKLPWRQMIAEVGANPPGAWWFLAFSPADYGGAMKEADARFVGRMIAAEIGIVTYALAARFLWAAAFRRLRGWQRQ